jgi:hypothetical protein
MMIAINLLLLKLFTGETGSYDDSWGPGLDRYRCRLPIRFLGAAVLPLNAFDDGQWSGNYLQ